MTFYSQFVILSKKTLLKDSVLKGRLPTLIYFYMIPVWLNLWCRHYLAKFLTFLMFLLVFKVIHAGNEAFSLISEFAKNWYEWNKALQIKDFKQCGHIYGVISIWCNFKILWKLFNVNLVLFEIFIPLSVWPDKIAKCL